MSLTEINAIIITYPVAGIDQSSQGFRDNFSNIKTALTDLDTQVITVIDDISDVDTTTVAPIAGDFFKFDGSKWVPLAYSLVDDTTPQLGGQLDVNGFALGDGTNKILDFVEAVTPVNWLSVGNAATGISPNITVTGSDTDVSLTLKTKNDGSVIIDTNGGTEANITSGTNLPLSIIAKNILTLKGGNNSTGTGYDTFVRGGSSTGSNGNGGSVFIRPGLPNGTGTNGRINLRDGDSNNIVVFQKTITSGTAVNYSIFYNGITGEIPGIRAFSSVDADVGFEIVTQGNGKVSLSGIYYPNTDGSTSGDVMKTDAAGVLSFASPSDLGEFTVAGLPDPTLNANSWALATNASGGRTFVRSDGTDWKVVAVEGATVTV